MTWRFVSGCATGTSHTKLGKPCDDSARCTLHTQYGNTLTLFVSDGAGSVPFGGAGAEICTQAAESHVKKRLAESPHLVLNEAFVHQLIQAIVAELQQAADQVERSIKAFACTFLGFISHNQQSMAIQIGDGGIVVECQGSLQLAIPSKQAGEYVNMTHFITDRHLQNKLRWTVFEHPITKVALFSDGLERLVVDLEKQHPHYPFFNHFFTVLSSVASNRGLKSLEPALNEFLNSSAVNERTDDDKSIALAIQLPPSL